MSIMPKPRTYSSLATGRIGRLLLLFFCVTIAVAPLHGMLRSDLPEHGGVRDSRPDDTAYESGPCCDCSCDSGVAGSAHGVPHDVAAGIFPAGDPPSGGSDAGCCDRRGCGPGDCGGCCHQISVQSALPPELTDSFEPSSLIAADPAQHILPGTLPLPFLPPRA